MDLIKLVVCFLIVSNGLAEESLTETSTESHCNDKNESESSEEVYADVPVTFPPTSFDCLNKYDGYYADVELDCVVFHYCQTWHFPSGVNQTVKWDFVCPQSTIFNQKLLSCTRPTSEFDCYDSPNHYWVNYNIFNDVPGTNSKPQSVPDQDYNAQQVENVHQESLNYPGENTELYQQGTGLFENHAPSYSSYPSYPSYSESYEGVQPGSHESSIGVYPPAANTPSDYNAVEFGSSGYPNNYDNSWAMYEVNGQDAHSTEPSVSVQNNGNLWSFHEGSISPGASGQIGQYPNASNENFNSSLTFSSDAAANHPMQSINHVDNVKPAQDNLTLSIELDVTINLNSDSQKHPGALNISQDGLNITASKNEEFTDQNSEEQTENQTVLSSSEQSESTASNKPAATTAVEENMEFNVTQQELGLPTEASNLSTNKEQEPANYSSNVNPVNSTKPSHLDETAAAFPTDSNSINLSQEPSQKYPADQNTYNENQPQQTIVPTLTDENPLTETHESLVTDMTEIIPASEIPSSSIDLTVPTNGHTSSEFEPLASSPQETLKLPETDYNVSIEPITILPAGLSNFPNKTETLSDTQNQPSTPHLNESSKADESPDILNFENKASSLTPTSSADVHTNPPSIQFPTNVNNIEGSGEPPAKTKDFDELVEGPGSNVKYFLIS